MAEVKIVYKPLDSLVPYANNPRRNEKAIGPVAASIREYGFVNPIVVDKDNVIICGHTRFLAAKRINLEQVPVIVADDLSERQIKAFRLADNRVAEIAVWDEERLHEELRELKDIFDMKRFGFSDVEKLTADLQKKHRCPKCGYEW